MTHLSLSFLGSPEVEHNGQAVSFPTRKTLALLIYLAVEGGMQPREKLAALFWPESRHKSGRASLRTTLALLRKELAHASQAEQQAHLNVTRDAIGFNSDADYTLDLEKVQAVVTQQTSRQSFDSAQDKPPISALFTAVSLIRGEFLEGFSLPDAPQFDDWVTFQQEQWHLRCRQLFDSLAEQQMERGETAAAIVTLNRWLALSPLAERAYRRLMRAHTITGNRPAALQLYEKCQSMLAAELGVEPSPETAALAERIRAADRVTRWQGDMVRSPASPHLVMTVVGRAEEHSQLVAAYHHVGHGRYHIVTVQGEAGIGKSSLAGQFLNWAAAQEATVLRGRAFESGGRLPYQPIVDLLRPLWRDGKPDDPNNELSPTWLAELSRLLPELHDIYPDLPPPTTDEATARTRLFEAVSRLGQALSRREPLVLFVDDIQWADAASLDLLQYVARRWHDAAVSIMLLFGVRSEALARAESDPSDATLQEWLASLGREAPLTRLKLTPLTAGDTQQLVKALVVSGEQQTDQLARWLYAETGGQPFFLAESVKALVDDGVLAWRQAEGEGLRLHMTDQGTELPSKFMPPGVRDVLLGRLARLSAEAFRLLAAGAVLGQAFGYRQLCRIAGLDADEGLTTLDVLLAANLLEETEEGERPYLFAHDKIRDVVYTEAGDARRRLFHERAYELLAESESPPAQIAHHARSAGLAEPAFRYAVAAGDAAMDLFAVRDAVTQYEQARSLLQEHPHLNRQIDPAQLHHLYGRLGRGYELLDAWDQAQAIEEEMLTLAEAIDSVPMRVTALNRLATVAIQSRMDAEKAADLLETAVALAEAHEDKAGLAEAEWNLAQTCFYRRNRPGAIRHGERALALAQSLEQPKLVARSHNILSYAKSGPASLPQLAQAKSHAAAAKEVYAALGNRAMEIDCLNMLGSIDIHSGGPAAAEPLLRRARDASVEIGNEWGQANTAFNLAQALLELGQYGEALARAGESVAIAQTGEPTPMVAGTLAVRGGVWRGLLALDAALEDHLTAKRLFADTPNPHITHLMAADLCADYALTGQWDEAHRCARQAMQ